MQAMRMARPTSLGTRHDLRHADAESLLHGHMQLPGVPLLAVGNYLAAAMAAVATLWVQSYFSMLT